MIFLTVASLSDDLGMFIRRLVGGKRRHRVGAHKSITAWRERPTPGSRLLGADPALNSGGCGGEALARAPSSRPPSRTELACSARHAPSCRPPSGLSSPAAPPACCPRPFPPSPPPPPAPPPVSRPLQLVRSRSVAPKRRGWPRVPGQARRTSERNPGGAQEEGVRRRSQRSLGDAREEGARRTWSPPLRAA